MNADSEAITHKLKNSILGIVPLGAKDKVVQEITDMEIADLLLWLTKQDPSLRYYLALDLDIPMQHLENTCGFFKKLHHL